MSSPLRIKFEGSATVEDVDGFIKLFQAMNPTPGANGPAPDTNEVSDTTSEPDDKSTQGDSSSSEKESINSGPDLERLREEAKKTEAYSTDTLLSMLGSINDRASNIHGIVADIQGLLNGKSLVSNEELERLRANQMPEGYRETLERYRAEGEGPFGEIRTWFNKFPRPN